MGSERLTPDQLSAKQQLASQVSKNALHNFDRIVIVTHCTSPIKVGATVGTAFLHFSPYDESYFGGMTFFQSRKLRETDVGMKESKFDVFAEFKFTG